MGRGSKLVHARKSEVEAVVSSEIQSRRTFCVRLEGGKRKTVLLEDSAQALSRAVPPATGRRASLSAGLAPASPGGFGAGWDFYTMTTSGFLL
eukprot:s1230_g2.t1